jgi:hypothetical protein
MHILRANYMLALLVAL